MRVKIFRFTASSNCYDKQNQKHEHESMDIARVEETLNDFMADKKIISVTPSTVDASYHNNAGYNLIEIIYTIVYDEMDM